MELQLTPVQFKTLSGFCNDVAKGLMLGTLLGQGALTTISFPMRLVMSLIGIITSLIMLYFALYFSKEAES